MHFSETRRRGAKSDDHRRRSREKVSGDTVRGADGKTRDERPSAWGAGVDSMGSFRDLRKNCCLGTGAHVPRHEGRSRQNLGNPRHLPRRAPGREGKDVCHWARNCPNRHLVETGMRRRF